ncbi:MAG: hypothetical protein ACLQLC_15715, partial [Candidatus Sulfotelmatobacter sp.]
FSTLLAHQVHHGRDHSHSDAIDSVAPASTFPLDVALSLDGIKTAAFSSAPPKAVGWATENTDGLASGSQRGEAAEYSAEAQRQMSPQSGQGMNHNFMRARTRAGGIFSPTAIANQFVELLRITANSTRESKSGYDFAS